MTEREAIKKLRKMHKDGIKHGKQAVSQAKRGNTRSALEHFAAAVVTDAQMNVIYYQFDYRWDEAHQIPELVSSSDEGINMLTIDLARELGR